MALYLYTLTWKKNCNTFLLRLLGHIGKIDVTRDPPQTQTHPAQICFKDQGGESACFGHTYSDSASAGASPRKFACHQVHRLLA